MGFLTCFPTSSGLWVSPCGFLLNLGGITTVLGLPELHELLLNTASSKRCYGHIRPCPQRVSISMKVRAALSGMGGQGSKGGHDHRDCSWGGWPGTVPWGRHLWAEAGGGSDCKLEIWKCERVGLECPLRSHGRAAGKVGHSRIPGCQVCMLCQGSFCIFEERMGQRHQRITLD